MKLVTDNIINCLRFGHVIDDNTNCFLVPNTCVSIIHRTNMFFCLDVTITYSQRIVFVNYIEEGAK